MKTSWLILYGEVFGVILNSNLRANPIKNYGIKPTVGSDSIKLSLLPFPAATLTLV